MANLVIIAGPNGAGKSTSANAISQALNLGVNSFDFDYEYYTLWARFDYDPVLRDNVFDRTGQLFVERCDSAILSNDNFMFESNYNSESIYNTISRFKNSGYQCSVIFILLEKVEHAISRVKTRVSVGGHNVDEGTIRYRFSKGLELLNTSFEIFDQVDLILSQDRKGISIASLDIIEKSVVTNNALPNSIEEQLSKINGFIISNSI